MSYQKQQFVDGETVLRKQHMDHIEDGIANNSYAVEEIEANMEKLSNEVTQSLAGKVDGWFIEDNILYLTANGNIVGDGGISGIGGGGGGGGGSNNDAKLTATNTTGWLSTTIRYGAACPLSLSWSSTIDEIPTGNGSLKVSVNGILRATLNIQQGNVTFDVGPLLQSGSNNVRLVVSDVYGNTRAIVFSIESISLSITSSFDTSSPYTEAFEFPFVPVGSVSKVIHLSIDGVEQDTISTTISNREMKFPVGEQTHGVHTLECWFTAVINEEEVESNHLFYEFVYLVEGDNTPIITTQFNETSVSQYSTISIPYSVYNPASLQAQVSISEDGELKTTLTVGREQQTYSYRAMTSGNKQISFTSGSTTKSVSFEVTAVDIDVKAETEGLQLYLNSSGRSNAEQNPGTWSYENIEAQMTGFNFTSDGWQTDADGATVLRIGGDARVLVPYKIFESDFRANGRTIEFEFATKDVRDYSEPVISCFSDGRGLIISSQSAQLSSEQSHISTSFKDGEHVRIAFVVQKRSGQRLILCYINGIVSGVVQYPDKPNSDDFSQTQPVDISLGGSGATLDVYAIRVYDHDLNRFQLLDNWIADTQNGFDLIQRFRRNNIFDKYGNIVIQMLPNDLPYMILSGDLPQYKGNKLIVSGEYVDPLNPMNSFTFDGAQIDVQGTSSQYYARKNYKIKFNEGFVINGKTVSKYAMNEDAIPTKTFTFKADVASSEGANNVELVRLYNEICPYKTPYQKENSKIRQGIDGFPIVIFHNDGTDTHFLGKYNFNNDKGTDEVYGFTEGDESWEILNNTSNRVLWKSDDYSTEAWLNDFEGRYPEDNTNPVNLYALARWLKSTDQTQATDNALPEPVVYEDTVYVVVEDGQGQSYVEERVVSTEYREDSATYRLAKFKHELKDYMELDSVIFFYLFTELFLMVDNRAKNAFPTKMGSDKWCILPYDFDTALGINNEGELTFSYNLEDIDQTEGGADVFNGQQSVLWVNLRQAFFEEIKAMYQNLRSTGKLSYEKVEQMFEDHQSKWSEAIFNEDAQYKYLDPLINDNDGSYLGMLQGSKAEQRKWWLYNRFKYIDSKYNAGDSLTDVITLRGYEKDDITVTPYADIYPTVKYGSYLVQDRGARNVPTTLVNPLDNVNDTEIYIYSSSQLSSIGDISGLKVGYADFSNAVKLQYLKIGDSSSEYNNGNMKDLNLGNNTLLQTLDVRNCSSLNKAIDLSGCTGLENVYFDGTAITGLALPNGGVIKKLHLPGTISNLTILNQTMINEFVCPDYSNITTLRIENPSETISSEIFNILESMPAASRVRIYNFNWEMDDVDELISYFDLFDTMRGLDQNGNNVDTMQIFGTVHVPGITGAQLAEIQGRYPGVTVNYDTIVSNLFYYDFYGNMLLYTESVSNGGSGVWGGTVSAPSDTVQYDFNGGLLGWSLVPESKTVNVNARRNITTDRNVYAVFNYVIKTYTATFVTSEVDGGETLYIQYNVPYGTAPVYGGQTPTTTREDHIFDVWVPQLGPITRDTTYTARFKYNGSMARGLIERKITSVDDEIIETVGQSAFRTCPVYTVQLPNASYIGSEQFYFIDTLLSVNIPNVEIVSDHAFRSCENLTGDFILNNVTSIGEYAFYSTKISSIQAPLATSIGNYAFGECRQLTDVEIPNVVTIGNQAFSGARLIHNNISCPNATYVGSYAFANCYRVKQLVLPNVEKVGESAFQFCQQATQILIPKVTKLGRNAFRSCDALTSVSLPVLDKLDSFAFERCINLLYVFLDQVTNLQTSAFELCRQLAAVVLGNENSVATLTLATNITLSQNLIFYVPDNLVNEYKSATNWQTFASRIKGISELPQEVSMQ